MKKKKTYFEFKDVNGNFGCSGTIFGNTWDGITRSFEWESEDDVISELLESNELHLSKVDFGNELWDFIKTQNKRIGNIRSTELHFFFDVVNGKCRVNYDYFLLDWNGNNDQLDKEGGFSITKKKVIEFLNNISKKIKFQYNPIKSFEFSWCLDDIEEINEDTNTYNEDCDYILKKLMKTNQISKGERCKGVVSWDDSKSPNEYKVDYTYCSQLGEDWDSDVWIDKIVKIKLK